MIEFYSPFSRKYLILTQTPQTYAEFASRFALAAIRTVHASLRCVFCVSLRSLREAKG